MTIKERTKLKRELPQEWIKMPIKDDFQYRYYNHKLRLVVDERIEDDDLSAHLARKNVHLIIRSGLTRPCLKDVEDIANIFVGQSMYGKAIKFAIDFDHEHDSKSVEAWFTFDQTIIEEYINS